MRGCARVNPLREDIRALIYKYGSKSEGEWTMLAEVSRIPLPGSSLEEALYEAMAVEGGASVSNQFDQMITVFNGLQEFVGSVSYPDVAVSPIAVYREVGARADVPWKAVR